MFKLLGTVVTFSFLCLDRNWQVMDGILGSTSRLAFIVDYITTETDGCNQYDNKPAKEDFTGGSYRYEVALPEFSGNFNVTIKYRAMMILAHERRLKQCDLTYYTVTTLPEYVDTSRAVWSFEFGTLTILMPGKKGLSEANSFARIGCYYDFSTDDIIVPRMTISSTS